jgi:hypothetical protein
MERLARLDELGETEIRDPGIEVGVKENIVWFEITVNDAILVQPHHPGGDADENNVFARGVPLWRRSSFRSSTNEVANAAAWTEWRDDRGAAIDSKFPWSAAMER